MTSLVNGLGGAAGFGEFSLPGNDDGSTGFIDLTPIFGTQGINFFGRYYTGFYLNNNGSVTFDAASSSFTPSGITGATSNPIIAAYWADIDTRGGAVAPTPGGTSTGSNLLWYDLDVATNTFTATWDDVGYYSGQTNKLNAFQLSIRQINLQGDFDITFRYENVDWTTGNASGGSDGLGGTPARAGYSAGNGIDYYELPQSGDQAALLALESASNIGTPGTYVFSVRNGVPTVGLTAGDASIAEGDGGTPHYLSIPVFLTEASSSTVTVHYSTTNGTALAGPDYAAQSGILTFAPGVTQQNILVAIAGDAIVEGNETFTITLSDPSDGASILDGSATGTIVNDDVAQAVLSIAATNAGKREGQAGSTAFTFTVTRTGDVSATASAQWAVTGAAVDGADFTGGILPSGTVSFAAGESTKVVSIGVAGDTLVESNEAFWVTLSSPTPGTTLGTASAKGVIRNDDSSLSIAATSADKVEGQSGSGAFTFTVTRTGDLSGAASAQWAVTGAAVDGTDFTGGILPAGTVSFAAGESTKTISIDVAGDTLVESSETFSVTLSNASAGTTLGVAAADGIIRNDDFAPAILSIAATSAAKAEGQAGTSAFTFTVTRTGDLSGSASAQWAVSGAAVTGADFTGGVPPSGMVSFAAGESTKVISITVTGDTLVESNEAFWVTLSDPGPGTTLGAASAKGIIRNDDASLSIVATDASKAEGDGDATAFTFTVTRSGDLSGAASAQWAAGGAAVDGADFAGSVLPSGTVSFAAGESTKLISIDVAGDTVVESNETFSVTLSQPTAGTSLRAASANGTIRNDDTSLSIAATSADKPEGDLGATAFTFTVTRSGDLSGTATVDWAASGSAVFDADFIPFDALLDSAAEISRSASELGAFFPQIPSDTDADAGFPAFSLFGGAMPSGTVSFAAGEASKQVTVWALGEILAERDESFVVTLSNASEGVTVDTASAIGTIRDDDGAGTVRSSVSFTLWPEFTRLVLTETANINGTGNGLDNQLFGNDGNNALDGRAGADRMAGGLGNDIYIVDDAGDVVFEATGEGTDRVQSAVSFSLADGFVENLTLTGGAGIDGMGNALGNQLVGNAGNNRLDGGAGNDLLFGKAGSDLLTGGSGKDSFVFDTPLDPSTNVDTILDFNVADDTIRLENAVFTALTVTGTLAEAAFHIGTAATTADHRIVYDSGSGDLFYDANGDAAGGSVRFAHLSPGLALTFQDLLVT